MTSVESNTNEMAVLFRDRVVITGYHPSSHLYVIPLNPDNHKNYIKTQFVPHREHYLHYRDQPVKFI